MYWKKEKQRRGVFAYHISPTKNPALPISENVGKTEPIHSLIHPCVRELIYQGGLYFKNYFEKMPSLPEVVLIHKVGPRLDNMKPIPWYLKSSTFSVKVGHLKKINK